MCEGLQNTIICGTCGNEERHGPPAGIATVHGASKSRGQTICKTGGGREEKLMYQHASRLSDC